MTKTKEDRIGVTFPGDFTGFRNVEKKWTDAEGAVHHEDFVEVRFLVPAADLDAGQLVELYKRHERCAVEVGNEPGQLSFLDILEQTKMEARAEAADQRKAAHG